MTLRLPAPFLSRPTFPLPPFPALMLMLVTQADLAKTAFERGLTNMRELANLVASANQSATNNIVYFGFTYTR